MKKKIVFLLYDSRSGSTFLSALLNRYQGISVSHEGPYVQKIIEYAKPLKTEDDLVELVDFLYSYRLMKELGLQKSDVLSSLIKMKKPYNKKNIIKNIINLYFNKRDPQARVVILKQSIYEYAYIAIETCPDLSFIHMVRDGRAVLRSKKKSSISDKYGFRSDIIKCANGWSSKIERMQTFRNLYPAHLHTVHYEKLLRNAEDELGKVLEFLNLNENEQTLTKSQVAYAQHIGKTQQRIHQNVDKPPITSRIDKWKDFLSAGDILLYEYIAGDSLRKMRYELINSKQKSVKESIILYGMIIKNYLALISFKIKALFYYLDNESSIQDFIKRRFNRAKYKRKDKINLKKKQSFTEKNRVN